MRGVGVSSLACTWRGRGSARVVYPGGAQDGLLASLASRGLISTLPGDPNNGIHELPPTVDTDVMPLGLLSHGGARGVKHIAAGIRRLSVSRHFLEILKGAPDQVRTKLLTHYGHGNVSVLLADIPRANNVSAEAARITIRRVT